MKHISLTVDRESLPRYTTLLQGGIYLEVAQGTRIDELLFALPDFSVEYVTTRIQTIFLNGLPADSIEQQLFGEQVVLAVSAAMPGLAGAIFRKGGIHASLRTETAHELSGAENVGQPICVRLKLFNLVAVERGIKILEESCVIKASTLGKFLAYRPPLLANIQTITGDGEVLTLDTVINLLETEDMITLTIRSNHGS